MNSPVTQTLPRLLIVDDERANMQALCETLAVCGYETRGCTDAASALGMLQGARFDLLLTDLRMPDMDGIELVRQALLIDSSLVAVLMTGHGSIATAVEAMQVGALDYILKPFKLSTALPVLARALRVRDLRQKNAELEAQVRQQLVELTAINSDLDAFSYSVSHDLRAPIQVVEGFSGALESSHSSQLDEKGLHYVRRIRASAARMTELVDGLLRLAHLSRQPIARTHVDVTALVESVREIMCEARVKGADAIQVQGSMPPAYADPVLLRQVYANLLSNACKFTSKLQDSEIKVGAQSGHEECIYFVRDNGAGFDMAHAAQLFQPFQRMHKAQEFEGLGVGLSIVQRVINRHGGRVWAEAGTDAGACFYFSLQPEPAAAPS
ncbi:MAG: response regulator [Pseudomonadota bacterium]